MSFSDEVRQELARVDVDQPCDRRAQLTAIFTLAGELHLRSGDGDPSRQRRAARLHLEVVTTSGAVARRVFVQTQAQYGVHPELRVRSPGGLRRRTRYEVVVADGARAMARDMGIIDEHGRPRGHDAVPTLRRRCDRLAYARGALLAVGSISAPDRPPHLEIAVPSEALGHAVVRALGAALPRPPTLHRARDRWRVVVKDGDAIGGLLARLGAPNAFLEWDDRRLRRALRGEAVRLANADRANLRRTVEAAGEQVALVERALATVGWAGLDEGLRQVALGRLANPEASLAELGELCDPPIGKSAVLRRLRRLRDLG